MENNWLIYEIFSCKYTAAKLIGARLGAKFRTPLDGTSLSLLFFPLEPQATRQLFTDNIRGIQCKNN